MKMSMVQFIIIVLVRRLLLLATAAARAKEYEKQSKKWIAPPINEIEKYDSKKVFGISKKIMNSLPRTMPNHYRFNLNILWLFNSEWS